jgi:hypothetical protein
MEERSGLVPALVLVGITLLGGCGPSAGPRPRSMDEKSARIAREGLGSLKGDIEIITFEGREAAGEESVAALSDFLAEIQPKISRTRLDPAKDKEEAARLGLTMNPAIVLRRGNTSGLRFFGYPGGYEFPVFIETVRRMAEGTPDLSKEGAAALANLRVPVNMKVFVTPG